MIQERKPSVSCFVLLLHYIIDICLECVQSFTEGKEEKACFTDTSRGEREEQLCVSSAGPEVWDRYMLSVHSGLTAEQKDQLQIATMTTHVNNHR